MSDVASRLICLGRLTSAHGIKGDVKALAAVDDLETLTALGEVVIDAVPYKISAARFQKRSLVLSLAGVRTRDQAEGLVGKDIWVDPGRLPALPDGEFYWFEVLGLEVYRADTGGYLGRVQDILPTPAHDVYVIRDNDLEYLVPAVAEVILAIDLDQGRLVITPHGLAAQSGAD